jgi:hypothetical protein
VLLNEAICISDRLVTQKKFEAGDPLGNVDRILYLMFASVLLLGLELVLLSVWVSESEWI